MSLAFMGWYKDLLKVSEDGLRASCALPYGAEVVGEGLTPREALTALLREVVKARGQAKRREEVAHEAVLLVQKAWYAAAPAHFGPWQDAGDEWDERWEIYSEFVDVPRRVARVSGGDWEIWDAEGRSVEGEALDEVSAKRAAKRALRKAYGPKTTFERARKGEA